MVRGSGFLEGWSVIEMRVYGVFGFGDEGMAVVLSRQYWGQ